MPDAQELSLPLGDGPGLSEGWEIMIQQPQQQYAATGARRAHLRGAIEAMTAAGMGAKRIAEQLGISAHVVRAVRAESWRRAADLAPLKESLGREYLATAAELRAAAMERIDEIPAHVLLLASAQAADKGQLLTGAPTARIEHTAGAAHADLNALVDSLPAIEVEAAPVESPAASAHKGPAGASPEVDGSACGDAGSPDLPQSPEGVPANGAAVGQMRVAVGTDQAAGAASSAESARTPGGGGGRAERAGGLEAH